MKMKQDGRIEREELLQIQGNYRRQQLTLAQVDMTDVDCLNLHGFLATWEQHN